MTQRILDSGGHRQKNDKVDFGFDNFGFAILDFGLRSMDERERCCRLGVELREARAPLTPGPSPARGEERSCYRSSAGEGRSCYWPARGEGRVGNPKSKIENPKLIASRPVFGSIQNPKSKI
jgi:hypothetical protein